MTLKLSTSYFDEKFVERCEHSETMITLQISQQEWETATTHWHDLSSIDAMKNDINSKKIEFLNQNVFNKNKIVYEKQLNVDVPSVTKMTEIMNEIEREIDLAKTTMSFSSNGMMKNDVDDTKDTKPEMLNDKENKVLKQFVSKPVKFCGVTCFLYIIVTLFFCGSYDLDVITTHILTVF